MNNSLQNIIFWIGKLLIMGVFLYFGTKSIIHPETFSSLVPNQLSIIISPETIVMIHGGVEIISALFILFGLGGIIPYIILIFSFVGVVFSVSGTTQIRDIGILGSLLLLIANYSPKKIE